MLLVVLRLGCEFAKVSYHVFWLNFRFTYINKGISKNKVLLSEST